jgi:hypothetical protein
MSAVFGAVELDSIIAKSYCSQANSQRRYRTTFPARRGPRKPVAEKAVEAPC